MARVSSNREAYDLAIVGGGTAGLVTAAGAARLGARVALIERARLGGECLWTGCVPSKALIRSAQWLAEHRRAPEFGLRAPEPGYAWPDLVRSVREVIARIEPHDHPDRFRGMGVDVVFGAARFLGPHELEVEGVRPLAARRIVLATGAVPAVPPVDGLPEAGYWTSDDIFRPIERQPESLLVLGAGPIGVELGQVFQRLGTRVTLIEMADRILPREDPEVADALRAILEAEGVRIRTGVRATRAEATPDGGKRVTVRAADGRTETLEGAALLVATGKRPNVEGLGLERAGVEAGPGGIRVDRTMRTTARHIWAAGDVTGTLLFTHVADYQARLVVRNAFFPVRERADYRTVPWAIFTDPELARVGPTEPAARDRYGDRLRVYRYPFETLDRAITDRAARGLVKILVGPRGRILGAHVLGPQAGALIHEIVLAMRAGARVGDLSRAVHAYPTLSEGIRRAADLYYADLFETSWMGRALRAYLRRALRR